MFRKFDVELVHYAWLVLINAISHSLLDTEDY